MILKPHGDDVYIKLRPKEDCTSQTDKATGRKIFLPEKSRQITRICDVIAVGEDVTLYEEGDVVLISAYNGIGINIPAMRFDEDRDRMIDEESILCQVDIEEE